jgi:hypothetical protein
MGCTSSQLSRYQQPVGPSRTWFPLKSLTTIKTEHLLQSPTEVRLRSPLSNDTGRRHVAVLSCNPVCPVNYIRHELVTKYLGEKVLPVVNKDEMVDAEALSSEGVKGYVELEWCLESDKKQWHPAHFFVTATADPAYDVVLGTRDAERLGMSKTYCKE